MYTSMLLGMRMTNDVDQVTTFLTLSLLKQELVLRQVTVVSSRSDVGKEGPVAQARRGVREKSWVQGFQEAFSSGNFKYAAPGMDATHTNRRI